MGLYPKKLRNVADLEREKKKLLARSRKLEDEDFLSLDSILGKGKEKNGERDGGSLLDYLPISNPFVSMAVKFIGNRLLKKKDSAQDGIDVVITASKKKSKHILKKVALEFVGGYLKWKAIELTYMGIKYLLKAHDSDEPEVATTPNK